jgi:hypothetical protein
MKLENRRKLTGKPLFWQAAVAAAIRKNRKSRVFNENIILNQRKVLRFSLLCSTSATGE